MTFSITYQLLETSVCPWCSGSFSLVIHTTSILPFSRVMSFGLREIWQNCYLNNFFSTVYSGLSGVPSFWIYSLWFHLLIFCVCVFSLLYWWSLCFYSNYCLTSLISYFNNFPDIFKVIFLISQKLCFILWLFMCILSLNIWNNFFLFPRCFILSYLTEEIIFNISPWLLPLSLLVSCFFFILFTYLFCFVKDFLSCFSFIMELYVSFAKFSISLRIFSCCS